MKKSIFTSVPYLVWMLIFTLIPLGMVLFFRKGLSEMFLDYAIGAGVILLFFLRFCEGFGIFSAACRIAS